MPRNSVKPSKPRTSYPSHPSRKNQVRGVFMAKQVSDLIVERLIEWGVDTIFGLPGDGVDGFFESLRPHQDKLRFIQVRHEEAAAFAAVGYAKSTGRLG